jgi:Lhr-like helicase
MPDFIAGRERVIDALRRELVGPAPSGSPIDCAVSLRFTDESAAAGPFLQAGSSEEILQFDRPVRRYGIGVLYPTDTPGDADVTDLGVVGSTDGAQASVIPDAEAAAPTERLAEDIERIAERSNLGVEPEPDDFDIGSANTRRPSLMGVSLLVELPPGSKITISASGGRYRAKQVSIGDRQATWWLRSPIEYQGEVPAEVLWTQTPRFVPPRQVRSAGAEGLDLRCEVYSRPAGNLQRLLTVCWVNRTRAAGSFDECCVFQARFEVTVTHTGGAGLVRHYPGLPLERMDAEERSIELLYRDVQTFAIGHGCAADWDTQPGQGTAQTVIAECLPVFERPSVTAAVYRHDGRELLEVAMASLAGLDGASDGLSALDELIGLYRDWIQEQRASDLPEELRERAEAHLADGERAADRMSRGLDLVRRDQHVRLAFQLANRAILLQQLRTTRSVREASYDSKNGRVVFEDAAPNPDPLTPVAGKGYWRPFQIAFFLAALESVSNGSCPERETVDLVWFPTGGGKTEAYLGLAAYAMFYRRLKNPADTGVEVLMRYTLRLLTAQQFQRASALLCAMEQIRKQAAREGSADLGNVPFSIGIWLGGSTTPNSRDEARANLRELQRGDRDAENKFLLLKCPWCSAQMGPLAVRAGTSRGRSGDRSARRAPRVIGYVEEGGSVVLRCPDTACEFSSGLPVYVVDEDVYEIRPAMVIGTVDKFAMLAWRPQARSLFGIARSGERQSSPPGLIIQDELHLISGPLGSMVGLYEAAIKHLCSKTIGATVVGPKIISSTATIRRFKEQILALYGRRDVALFPPRGIRASDSFFASYATKPDGTVEPGTAYLGIHAPGLGSLQTAQVRTFAALMQAAMNVSRDEADPWWTLLIFFNSLRELGNSLSLFQSDIRDYLTVLRRRYGTDFSQVRQLRQILELTGRLRSSEVPKAIAALEVDTSGRHQPIDACLASSIIEVGIDIDRLSLLSVVGQPKTTAQYIQVTGRIGRRWWERPGLVATIYTASKPRDRSHFEKFRSYHERLYAAVEPTSVTPFSPAVLDRALHAVMAVYVRQLGAAAAAERPYPVPEALVSDLARLLIQTVTTVDPEEQDNLQRMLERRLSQWRRWKRTRWDGQPHEGDIPLLREAGAYATPKRAKLSWPTPQSMRDVDAECQAEVTHLYLLEGEHV